METIVENLVSISYIILIVPYNTEKINLPETGLTGQGKGHRHCVPGAFFLNSLYPSCVGWGWIIWPNSSCLPLIYLILS